MTLYLGTNKIAGVEAPIIDQIFDGTSINAQSGVAIQGVLNNKADVDLTNSAPTSAFATAMNTAGIRTVVETYKNGTEWYRVWSDGWCEQGGYIEHTSATVGYITLLKPYLSTDYRIFGFGYGSGGAVLSVYEGSQTASSFGLANRAAGKMYAFYANWYTQGYIR